jgi:hypothetical protein
MSKAVETNHGMKTNISKPRISPAHEPNPVQLKNPRQSGRRMSDLITACLTLLAVGATVGGFAQEDRLYGNVRVVDGRRGAPVETRLGGTAELIYDEGFMHMLMKDSHGGVKLLDMDLIENDSPGSGMSEKGAWTHDVWGDRRARKVLVLDDPRADQAWLVVYAAKSGDYPLSLLINGNLSQLEPQPKESNETYRWTEFPATWLKKGPNTIEMYCPKAKAQAEGWSILIARADEFADGGGDPTHVGETSFVSDDDGGSWSESLFGPEGDTRAEVTVRLSLDRYVKSGWLASPVIDLWRGDDWVDFITPLREIQNMSLSIRAEVPEGTRVDYHYRKGFNTNPHSPDWEPYERIGSGPTLDFEVGGIDLNRRYIQFRIELATTNPLRSPVIQSAKVGAELLELVPRHENLYVVEAENPVIQYSSIPWEWEESDRPEFEQLREQENLDEVIAGSRTGFDAQVKLMDYVTRRWPHTDPEPGYPPWDAVSIFNHICDSGGGGQCAQFNNAFGGLCLAFGWQSRMVNAVRHELIEVWSDEFGKWILFDADYDNNYCYDPETGEPLSMLELHQLYMRYYYPDRPIDWMKDTISWEAARDAQPVPVKRGSTSWKNDTQFGKHGTPTGFANAAHMRMVPRNNWYAKPTPRPLNHGSMSQWPWDGYINWYDPQTPRKRQYSWFTDRPRDMWPDLNLVQVDATQGFGNDRLFLRFDTYTPNFRHFEIDVDDSGWRKVGARWAWLLQSGRNALRVRAVNRLGATGRPSSFIINHADAPFAE